MPLRNSRSLRRNLALLCFVLLFFYLSGRLVSRNTPPVIDDNLDTLDYVRPQSHQEMRPDGKLQVDWQRADPVSKEARLKLIDRKYCGRDRCRFMLPVAITEQESKAQEHFRQLAFLSGKLDRTIVLPNVHSSHLGACRRYPFSFYYDDDWLVQNQEHFSYITAEDFNKWIDERNQVETPTSQEVYIEISENLHFLDKAKNCYAGILDYTGWPTKRFYLDDPEDFSKREGNYTEILLHVLSDETRKSEYVGSDEAPPLDVISLLYDRRFTYIENPEAYTPLSYSKHWTKIADAIAEQLSPFVAIHWRMERLEPVTNMVPCAKSLVEKVKDIENHSDRPLRLFLLTDYPHLLNTSKAMPESMSFKLNELTQDHHDAIKYVYDRLDVYLTTLKRENQPIPYDELPADHWNLIPVTSPVRPPDMSVLGIIDKLVAMRAEYFLAGKPAVCGKQSSFTKRIMEERLQAYSAGDPTIRLPMDYFAL